MDTLYIVMPAYNEAENIEDVISQWHPIAEQINAEGNICKIIVRALKNLSEPFGEW